MLQKLLLRILLPKYIYVIFPANTRHQSIAGSMLVCRLWCWPSIDPVLCLLGWLFDCFQSYYYTNHTSFYYYVIMGNKDIFRMNTRFLRPCDFVAAGPALKQHFANCRMFFSWLGLLFLFCIIQICYMFIIQLQYIHFCCHSSSVHIMFVWLVKLNTSDSYHGFLKTLVTPPEHWLWFKK